MVLVMNGHFYLKTVHGFRPKVPAGVGAGHVSYAESNLASGMSDMRTTIACLLVSGKRTGSSGGGERKVGYVKGYRKQLLAQCSHSCN